jgi:hypothetical protein
MCIHKYTNIYTHLYINTITYRWLQLADIESTLRRCFTESQTRKYIENGVLLVIEKRNIELNRAKAMVYINLFICIYMHINI